MGRVLALTVMLFTAVMLSACSLASPAPAEQPDTLTPQTQVAPAQQPAQPVALPTRRPSVSNGASLYQQKCVRCHGEQGRGDGQMAAQIQSQFNNPVADLTSDVIARAKTPEQWYDVVSNGHLSQGMPGFSGSLDVDQRWDVIVYAWSLAAPANQVAHGQGVYTAQCTQCHGAAGKGDGKDAQGQLPDFSNFGTLAQIEAGRLEQDLASAHVPSFAGTLSDDERRAAIDYVRTLAVDSASAAAAAPATPASANGALSSAPAGPTAPIEIAGKIINGTAGMSVPDNLTMTLYILPHQGTDQNMITRTFTSGVGGQFSITTTQTLTASLLAAGVEYKGLNFFSEVAAAGPEVTLPITIYESTQDTSHVTVDTLHLIVEPAQDGLNVSEIYVISNNGDRFVAGFGAPVMHFTLPAGATNLQLTPEMQNVTSRTGDGLDYFDGIPVGRGVQQVVYQYSLPSGVTDLSRVLHQSVGSVNLLVQGEPGKLNVTSSQLASQGTQSIQGNTYQQYSAANLQPNQTLTMSIGATAPFDWRIALGIGLIVVGLIGLVIWQRGQRKQPLAAGRSLAIQKEALIDQIAALDDDFAEGKIDEASYKAKRAKLKEILVELMSEE